MDDQFKNVLLRELQRFTEAQMRQAVAQEEIAGALHRIGVKMKPSHVTAPDQPTAAAQFNRTEMVVAARMAAEKAEDDLRHQIEAAINETNDTIAAAIAEDELGKLQAGAPSPVDGRR